MSIKNLSHLLPLRRFTAAALLTLAACSSAPVVPPPPPPVAPELKLAWILRLEDLRILIEPLTGQEVVAPPPMTSQRGVPVAAPPPARPDLVSLVADSDPRIRRRAALAIGRVGLVDGIGPLQGALADVDPEVRQMAAFALGLIGDGAAAERLRDALADAEPIVRGRAAEALGLIGDASAAPAIGQMAAAIVEQGSIAALAADEERPQVDPAVDAFRLAMSALVRLKAYEPLAGAVLDAKGLPRVQWWPVAYALQRIEDRRAIPALRAIAQGDGIYNTAFAARGLGVLKDAGATDVLVRLVDVKHDPRVRASAIRALGQIGDARAVAAVQAIAQARDTDPNLRLEAITALGLLKAGSALDLFLDMLGDPWPAMRAAALRSVAQMDPGNFIVVLSGLDPDPHWSVRAALANVLESVDPEVAGPRLESMLDDEDQRVIPSVLTALAKVSGGKAAPVLLAHLKKSDPYVRGAAAAGLGEIKAEGAVPALVAAYTLGLSDPTYSARAAAIGALAKFGTPDALAALTTALTDKEWAVRVRAAELLHTIDPAKPVGELAKAIRPAPSRRAWESYQATGLVSPGVSPHVYIDTDKGTIQVELAVLDAPLTAANFMELARKGYFNGIAIHRVVPNFVVQDGDPRGDGEGGPGYSIRDELNELPYLRGVVGMALDWRDTGGSQFFITHSPQPHLDARYTVFGHVVAGMEVVDKLRQWDVIQRVRVWDGTQMSEK